MTTERDDLDAGLPEDPAGDTEALEEDPRAEVVIEETPSGVTVLAPAPEAAEDQAGTADEEPRAAILAEEPAGEVADPHPDAPGAPDTAEQVAAASSAAAEILPKRRLGFRSRWALAAAVLFGLLVLGVSGISVAAYQYARSYDGKILPGATIAGVDVGGLNKAQALAKVRAAIRPELHRDLKIHWQASRWHATPAKLGARSDARRAVEDALYASSTVSFVDKVRMRLGGDLDFDRGVAIRYPKGGVQGFVQGLASSFDQDAQDAYIDYDNTWVKVMPSKVGREIDVEKSTTKLLHALRKGAASTSLIVATTKPEVTEDAFQKVLLLHIGDNRLYLYENGKITHTYTVATGQSAYPTPQGEFEVVNKRYMPTWVNPAPDGWGADMPASIPPGPGNPLGVRAIDWSASGIRFHSTSDLGSIGHNASHGCVRMTAADVIELYDLVDIGTPIVSIQTGPYS